MKRLVLIAILGLMTFAGHAADTNRVVNYGFRLGANLSQPLLKGLPVSLTCATPPPVDDHHVCSSCHTQSMVPIWGHVTGRDF